MTELWMGSYLRTSWRHNDRLNESAFHETMRFTSPQCFSLCHMRYDVFLASPHSCVAGDSPDSLRPRLSQEMLGGLDAGATQGSEGGGLHNIEMTLKQGLRRFSEAVGTTCVSNVKGLLEK